MARRKPMSMEAMLDEERREVLALLETKPRVMSGSNGARSSSPFASNRSPVRSMLDITPVRSMLDVDGSAPAPVRSMLDVDSPPSSASSQKPVFSNPSSPTLPRAHSSHGHPRSMSDAAAQPIDFGPKTTAPRLDPTANYQFSDIITSNSGHALPKRVTQGRRTSRTPVASSISMGSSMSEFMRGNDVSGLILPGDRGPHYSGSGPSNSRSKNTSRSPHSNLGIRSKSPHNNVWPGQAFSSAGKAFLADQGLDYASAYTLLSDANLARSGGTLSEISRRKMSDEAAATGRLVKDYLAPDGEMLGEESTDDGGSSEDERDRGRKAARFPDSASSSHGDASNNSGSESPETKRKTLSLLAAAEEERLQVAAQQPQTPTRYRSLLDPEPEITVTNPMGERVRHSKSAVHPATSFDDPPHSDLHTPIDSDTEQDLEDVKRAQKLSFSSTRIINYPTHHRSIQIITRGEYANIVQEGEEDHRTPRKYLVATDMSEESTHALEWAIGTVLRDGDTLLAIYCVDEEAGVVTGDGASVPDEPKAMKEQAAAIHAVTTSRVPITPTGVTLPVHFHQAPPLANNTGTNSVSASPAPSSQERTKAEEERHHAVHDISERVLRLLRKTRLQVRVIVEVTHCKNPKHLITEVIDVVDPTLVILGSRGRSALKGVILGSFSNYLVTKSSVPVMVARKRLRKSGKYKRPLHQPNNLSTPMARSLANAKVD